MSKPFSASTEGRKRMTPFRGWAMVGPDGHIQTICKAPSVYGKKRDVLLDRPSDDYTARRVLITEIR